jgi:hypothetical protein
VLNPVTDRTFAAFAAHELDGAGNIEVFEARLRARYPPTAVHARVLSGEPATVWYVYRDGHWISAHRAGG